MVEGAKHSPLAVHRQIPRRPDRRGTHVAGENRIFRRKLIENSDNVLRVDRLSVSFSGGEFIETFARFLIMFDRSLQVVVVPVLFQLWQERLQCRLSIAHKTIVDLGASAELFTAEINL